MQPSVLFVAPRMDGYCPGGQSASIQAEAVPPADHKPIAHFVHPSTFDVAPTVAENSPALQSISRHEVAFSPSD